MIKSLIKIAFLPVALGLLTACDTAQEPEEPAVQAEAEPEPYRAPEPGFIQNPGFAPGANGGVGEWKLLQHSSNTSYALSLDGPALVIERTGDEPWGKLRQRFARESIEPLLGKTLEFSAELKGEFTDEYGEPIEPSGLSVLVKGLRKGAPAMLGVTTLLSEKAPMPVFAGPQGWQRYAVTFELPPADQVRAARLEVAVLMTRGGKLKIRGPSLREVGAAP